MKFFALICGVFAININNDVAKKHPLTAKEKAQVGEALSGAIAVLNGDKRAESKLTTCLRLFPDRVQGKESNSLWNSCKDAFAMSLAAKGITGKKQEPEAKPAEEKAAAAPAEAAAAAPAEAAAEAPAAPKMEVDKEGYEKDWLHEHKSGNYPAKAEGLQHHPKYGGAAGMLVATGAVVAALMV